MNGAIVFEPFIPLWALTLAAALAGLVAIVSLVRAPRGGVFRTAAIAALLTLIANPLVRIAERTPLSDVALVLVDRSASQRLDGRLEATDAAAARLTAQLKSLGDTEVRVIDVAGEEETRLAEALKSALADTPRARLSAVFIVTDGQTSDADGLAALRVEAPVHIFSAGREGEIDRKINLLNAPRYGIVKEPARIAFRVDDLGRDGAALAGDAQATVTLRIDGKEVLSQNVPVGVDVSFRAPLDRPGRTVIELEVVPLAGELSTRNNLKILPITAVRDRMRVLLISGEPHPGERVWRNLLKSDPAVDLVHFTILRPVEKDDGTPNQELALIPFPQDELFIEKLSEFDLLIFDRYTYRGVLSSFHFDNIARYVENGGAVLIASGPEFNGMLSLARRRNLAFILPATPSGGAIERLFRPQITEAGRKHPVTAGLPEESFWGRWLRFIPAEIRSGETLMSGPDGRPLLVLDHVLEGRVGMLLSDHAWLWARGFDGGGPHAELLRRIAHWLMKEPELEEEQLALRSDGGALIIERRSMTDAPGPVRISGPEGATYEAALSEIAPGRFAARIENAPRGLYRASDGDLFAVGAVGLAAAPEFENVVSDSRKLRPLAEATGGDVFSIRRGANEIAFPAIRRLREGATSRSGPGWAGVVARDVSRIDSVRDAPLAPPALWLAFILGALLAAWLAEGRFGKRAQ
ncbi:MAG: hypothetical protein ACE5FO_10765 [Parvularculaceae bacterium]